MVSGPLVGIRVVLAALAVAVLILTSSRRTQCPAFPHQKGSALVMCVRNLSIFTPSPLRVAWGLVATRSLIGYPGAALLRTGPTDTRAPSALLRAAGPAKGGTTATTHCKAKPQWVPAGRRVPNREVGCGPVPWGALGARFMLADFGHGALVSIQPILTQGVAS